MRQVGAGAVEVGAPGLGDVACVAVEGDQDAGLGVGAEEGEEEGWVRPGGGGDGGAMVVVGIEGQDVPGIEGLAVGSRDGERANLVLCEAEDLGAGDVMPCLDLV